jgi:hypothetical protein
VEKNIGRSRTACQTSAPKAACGHVGKRQRARFLSPHAKTKTLVIMSASAHTTYY